MRRPDGERRLAFLGDARSYRDGTRRVGRIETHFAWVFLTRTRALKLKKPLRQGGMDYRTLAQRCRGCRDEVRLNRRLAPRVYVGAWRLCADRSGRLRLGPRRAGRVLDCVVLMRRLAAARMLDATLRRRALTAAEIERVAAHLARFFGRARPVRMTPARRLERLRRQGEADAAELLAVHAPWRARLQHVRALQRRFMALRRAALAARAACVIEGHGDLRPEHVWLGPPVAVIDCLEFDRRLRLRDPAEELAYLRLELTRLRAARLGRRLCVSVLERLGDAPGEALVSYYMSLQALTRAKLAAWHVGDPQFPDPRPWLRRAASYLEDARRHAARALRLAASEAVAASEAAAPVARAAAAVGRAATAQASAVRRRRPALQQRRQRPAVAQARQRLRKERRHRQDRRAR